jgi:C1A family cysteine protease
MNFKTFVITCVITNANIVSQSPNLFVETNEGQLSFADNCQSCIGMVTNLENQIIDQLNTSQVQKQLDGYCDKMSSSFSTSCREFVDEYGPHIVKVVETILPHEICSQIGLCSEKRFNSFKSFVKTHKKKYNTRYEAIRRATIFHKNEDLIAAHNERKDSSYKLSMNHLGDMTVDEVKDGRNGFGFKFGSNDKGGSKGKGIKKQVRKFGFGRALSPCDTMPSVTTRVIKDLPFSVDWRTKGAVSEVKNQQQCGSCWSYSTTGAIEGAHKVYQGTLVSLSEQQFVDCSTTLNNGCNGGEMDFAFGYAMEHGICTEASYPYVAHQHKQCYTKKMCGGLPHVKVKQCFDVPANNERMLQYAVTQQPIAVAIEADKPGFQFYSSGIYDDTTCGTSLDHGVLAVGYGRERVGDDVKEYWIVKNSWGATWGDGGFIKIARDSSNVGGPGRCGIAMQPSYPVV